ncbi:MAG: transporter substrate-binding domain-containing protein [Clostridia bacterium]|nr:transporter substrate-binding domain-containing protein [Clostridia bacterium]
MRRNPYKIGRSEGRFASFLKRSGIKLTLKGREGRFLRTVLIALGVIILLIALFKFLKPETQLMSSVEIRRIESRGTLNVGVRGDMPGFCEGGEGLEAELAKLLAKRILPDSADPCRLNVCSPKSVSAKLSDGTVDIAIALLPRGSVSSAAYSYTYFTDKVHLVTLDPSKVSLEPHEMVIGYIPETSAGGVFASYVSRVTSTGEQSLIDRLLRRPKATPDPASVVTMETRKYGSYDELIAALRRGDVDAIVMAGAYVYRYFEAEAGEGAAPHYLCSAEIGSLDYCIAASSDQPALTQIADMLIYEMRESGLLHELINKYVPASVR